MKDTELNYTSPEIQNLFCSSPNCNLDSLSSQVYLASKLTNRTYIGKPASSWLDDYFDWSSSQSCCKEGPGHSFCPHDSFSPDCKSCPRTRPPSGRPSSIDFKRFLTFFLKDNPDETCAKGGHASYSSVRKNCCVVRFPLLLCC